MPQVIRRIPNAAGLIVAKSIASFLARNLFPVPFYWRSFACLSSQNPVPNHCGKWRREVPSSARWEALVKSSFSRLGFAHKHWYVGLGTIVESDTAGQSFAGAALPPLIGVVGHAVFPLVSTMVSRMLSSWPSTLVGPLETHIRWLSKVSF